MGIQNKLFLTLLTTSFCLVLAMFAFMRWSVDRGMLEYVNTKEAEQLSPIIDKLAALYLNNNGWESIKHKRRLFHQVFEEQLMPPHQDDEPPPSRDFYGKEPRRPPPADVGPPRKFAVLDNNKAIVFGYVDNNKPQYLIAIEAQGKTVGWLSRPKRQAFNEGFELTFIQQQTETFIIISVAIFFLAIMLSYPLAKHFIKPITLLGLSISRLNQGQYSPYTALQQLKKRNDELGKLARDVQELSYTLNKNDDIRKRWLADTSHELRTPISIILGELEAMIDTVRPLNMDNIQSVLHEVKQLQRLIDDLHELSNADIGGLKYKKQRLELIALIQEQCSLHQQAFAQAKLQIHRHFPSEVYCYADPIRIAQLLDNILSNCQKYCGEHSQVYISATNNNEQAIICIEDSGKGVPEDSLDKLFDHLYRVEDSRNRNTGGSGLGLAICKRIIEGHNGSITAQHSEHGGLKILFTLNLDKVTL